MIDSSAVQADVHGNLGPPSKITEDIKSRDWIKDRWQAAANMQVRWP